jgi:hypothetical protein
VGDRDGAPAAAEGGLLSGIVRGWDRFWFRPADPTTLALVRICCGALTLYIHLCYSWGLLSYVGPDAWLHLSTANQIRREQPIYTMTGGWDTEWVQWSKGHYYWSVYYHIQDPRGIAAVHAAILVVMALFTLGLWTRYTAVLAWVGAMCYVQRSWNSVFGVDTMMMITLCYLMLGPSGDALSLDRWLLRRRDRRRGVVTPPPEPAVSANFAIRLIQVHFCIIYLVSGTSKLLGPSWWALTAPNKVLLNYYFAPFAFGPYTPLMAFLAKHRWLWESVMSLGVLYTLAVEIGVPF